MSNPKPVGSDGLVQFGARPPGQYEVVLLAVPGHSFIAICPVGFEAGDRVKEVSVPKFHRLLLKLPKDPVDPSFSLQRKVSTTSWSRYATTGANPSELSFDLLTEGTYRLTGHVGERWVSREVHIPTDSVIRLD